MKSIDKHIEDLATYNQVSEPPMLCLSPIALKSVMKQIRLEAAKEGMRRAETVTDKVQNDYRGEYNEVARKFRNTIKRNILSAAEQLTEKDLE